MLRHAVIGVVSTLLSVAGQAVRAQDVPGYALLNSHSLVNGPYDARELAMLPRFCNHTQLIRMFAPGGSDKNEIARWTGVFGDSFQHLHHYCWGLMKSNRANLLARDPSVRQFFLNDAVGEYDYVIDRVPKDFILLPEILYKKADNLFRLGRAPVAIFHLERAIELKPDYWPPYAAIADHYKEVGQTAKSREILEAGLAAAPGTPALTRRLAELGSAGRP